MAAVRQKNFDCSVIRSSFPSLLRGYAAHLIELDDGHRKGAVHVGATVFSALLSVAEKEKISSRDFLLGAIIGYESTVRLACAIQPGNKLRGYHATGTCGTVGAALGIAAALHFTEEQMKTTLSAAVTSAAGVLEMQEDDSDLKPYNVGRAAMDAVAAAYIGKSGLGGPNDPLGGKRGFLKVMTDTPHPEFLTDFNSDTLCIEQIYQKTYAACRHAHPAIEAALALRNEIDLAQIEKLQVRAYRLAVAGHDHTQIQGVSSAKMSIPFGVAVSLVTGSAGLSSYSEKTISDDKILELTRKVNVLEDEELTALCPEKRASILTVHLSDGKTLTKRVDYPKGEPENPLSQDELEAKFQELAVFGGLTKVACVEVIKEVQEKDFGLEKIMGIVQGL
jgi:2-methylcitrate dehydratase PrpD